MPMNPVKLIATRYLFSRKNISLISTLTVISVLGVTIGTALLIVVLSVFNGFFDLVKGLLLSYDPDIRIESVAERTFLPDAAFEEKLRNIPEINMFSPYLEGKVLLAHRGSEEKVVNVRGINTESFFDVIPIDSGLDSTKRDLSVINRSPGILVGSQLSSVLGLRDGDRVSLLSATSIQRSLTQFSGPRYYSFEIRGSFYLQQVFEGSLAFVDLEAAQRMFNVPKQVSGYDLRLHNQDHSDRIKALLEAELGPSFQISTWYDLQKPLYDVMNIEKWSAFFILMLIIMVAVLNIVGSLTMIVIQKSRDIGVLMSFGYSKRTIRSIFLRQGVLIGLIGCTIGGVLGLSLTWAQHVYGIVKIAGSDSFIIDAYPVVVNPLDIVLILAGSMLFCIVASWYPARRASALQPSDVLRYE